MLAPDTSECMNDLSVVGDDLQRFVRPKECGQVISAFPVHVRPRMQNHTQNKISFVVIRTKGSRPTLARSPDRHLTGSVLSFAKGQSVECWSDPCQAVVICFHPTSHKTSEATARCLAKALAVDSATVQQNKGISPPCTTGR